MPDLLIHIHIHLKCIMQWSTDNCPFLLTAILGLYLFVCYSEWAYASMCALESDGFVHLLVQLGLLILRLCPLPNTLQKENNAPETGSVSILR
jgi:hypothetical protein